MSLLLALLGPTSSNLVGTPLLTNTNSFPAHILQLEAVTPPYTFEGYGVGTVVANSTTVTYSTGETVLIVLQTPSGTRPTGCSDGTNTYTLVGNNTVGNYSIGVFKANNVVGGTYTLTSSTNVAAINYYRYRNIKPGVAQAVITGEFNNPGSYFTNNVVLPTITPTESPAMVFIAGGDQNAGGLYVGTDFISRGEGNLQVVAGDRRVTTTNPITPLFTGSAFEWTDYVVAIFSEALIVSDWCYPRPIESTNDFFAPTVAVAGSAPQTLTPALYTNTSSYYAPTISVTGGGAQTLIPSLYSNTNSYYNSTITVGGVTLLDPLLTNVSTYYSPIITVGAVTLTPALYTNSSTLYTPNIGLVQALTVPLLTNTNSYFTTTITTGVATVSPALYTNNNSYFTTIITTGAVTVTTPLLSNTSTVYAPIISAGVNTLLTPVITSSNVYYLPTVVKGVATVAPTLFTNTATYYTPSIVPGAVGIQAPTIASNSATYAPEVYALTTRTIEVGNIISYVPSNNIIVNSITYYYVQDVLNEDFVTFTEVPHYLTNVIVDNYIQAA